MKLREAQIAKFVSDEGVTLQALQLFFANESEGFTAGLLLEGSPEAISANMVRVAKLIEEKGKSSPHSAGGDG